MKLYFLIFIIKDIFSTTLGIIVFQDLKMNRYIILGLTISYIGTFIYSYFKIKENMKSNYKKLNEENVNVGKDIELKNDQELDKN